MNTTNTHSSPHFLSRGDALSINSATPRRWLLIGPGFLHLAVCASLISVSAWADIVNVAGTSGPWMYVNGGLNTSFQYGVGDQAAPTVITSIGSVNLSAGQTVTLAYQSGTVNYAGFNNPPGPRDANGYPGQPNPGSSPNPNGTFPSHYMNESLISPKFPGELVGTFANSSGQIVGSPFAVGNGPAAFVVPSGATALQLGVNDNVFGDNVGSWNILVTAIPEPATAAVFGIGTLALAYARRKRRADRTKGN